MKTEITALEYAQFKGSQKNEIESMKKHISKMKDEICELQNELYTCHDEITEIEDAVIYCRKDIEEINERHIPRHIRSKLIMFTAMFQNNRKLFVVYFF